MGIIVAMIGGGLIGCYVDNKILAIVSAFVWGLFVSTIEELYVKQSQP